MIGTAGHIVIRVGGAAVGVAGASTAAASAATVILASGAAVAIGVAGYGAYRWITSDMDRSGDAGNQPPLVPQVQRVTAPLRGIRSLCDRLRPR